MQDGILLRVEWIEPPFAGETTAALAKQIAAGASLAGAIIMVGV